MDQRGESRLNLHRNLDVTGPALAAQVLQQGNVVPQVQMAEERLPFTIKVARSDEQLGKAVAMRHAAYARHVPALAELLKAPEANDRDEGSVVLLAESKLDGSPVGTLRIQTNRFHKLVLEQSVELPRWLQDNSLAEVTRLGVSGDRTGRVVKTMLFKALFEYCEDAQVDWLVIGARSPLDRQYRALLFKDVFPGGEFFPLSHAGNMPHRILAFEMESAEARWAEANHPLYSLFRRTRHPDIQVRNAGSALSHKARQSGQASQREAWH
jgi:hypothetical protein